MMYNFLLFAVLLFVYVFKIMTPITTDTNFMSIKLVLFDSKRGRVQAEGDNFCDLKILCIYFFNVKLGLVG